MGKDTGFLEIPREQPQRRKVEDRVRDWFEIYQTFPEEKQRDQGARCMDCGVPFCHTGCPVNNLIPDWNDLVYHGRWEAAIRRLHATNNFPEFTGRICPAPCEASCVLGIDQPPVSIKLIERSIVERGWEEGWIHPEPPEHNTGKRVAVVGSGPAGLAAAQQLRRAGHSVTVYEKNDRIGGLLRYGIPNFKLEKNVLDRRIEQMRAEGVTFITNAHVGVNVPAETLTDHYDAILLAGGAEQPRNLNIPGRELKGIHFAMDFLTANTKSILDSHKNGDFIDASGKDVVVIGGGDTGTDCVGTSIRHGCKSLVQVEILPKPPLERAKDNPWPEWPKTYKLDYGQEEAAAKFGADPRVYLTTATKFEGDAHGHVNAVHLVQIEWTKNDKGQFVPKNVPGTEKVLPAQLVLLAMGFLGPEQPLLESLGIERDTRSNARAEFEKYTTNIRKVFAAGDCRRGQSLVVWAFNEGRGAARECDRFLMGATDLP